MSAFGGSISSVVFSRSIGAGGSGCRGGYGCGAAAAPFAVAAAAAASADGTTPEKLLTHAGQHHLAASLRHLLASGWKLLEHEEGRELAGLTMLLLHTLAVFAELHSRVRNGLAFRSATARALKMSLVALLTGAIYLWVVHQRELNAKYAEPHCGGQLDFASVDQGDPGTTKGS
mmetsp:Transcript_12865/g.32946  ORF Transcript_12865/g.32946 Transcript_12865/m.32946 type:complete len:174 (+) Transcript_12865:1137-1658(+)